MGESEQLSSFLVSGVATDAAAVAESPGRAARLVRAWAGVLFVLTLLNLALAIGYLLATGDRTAFLSHQAQIPFLALIYAGLAVAVVTHRPRNPIGPLFLGVSTSFVLSAWAAGAPLYAALAPNLVPPVLYDLAQWLSNWVWLPAQILPVTFVFLLFPDGHLLSPRWRLVGWAAGLGLLSLMVVLAAHPGPVAAWGTQPNPFGIAGAEGVLTMVQIAGSALLAAGIVGSLFSVVVRFRRSRGMERAQMKWLVYTAATILAVSVLAIPLWLSGRLATSRAMEWSITLTNVMTLSIAVAATVAIVRYRLYDIDVVINRTLVYGLMTGIVLMIYGVVVGGVGVLLQTETNWLAALLATGLVAVLFQPIHRRLQRGVNRLLYGQRDEPFEVLSQLGQRLELTLTPDAVYPTIVETVAQALRLPYVALEVSDDVGFQLVESYGRPIAQPATLPLTNQGEVVGRLLVSARTAREEFSEADQRLLQNIARQAGAAVHNAQLTADLQRSRQQLVTGREEERRRLRRDLHDGLGPSLASLLLEARVLRRMIRDDPTAAEKLAGEMQGDIRATIDDIRRVVHELRPPALDDLGLVPAINVLAAKIGGADDQNGALRVDVEAPDDLPALPAAVEVAAYRIIQEALANVVHHAGARCATVRLWLESGLQLEVTDDGAGFTGGRLGGLGLRSMRERAAELGGSCTISGSNADGTRVRATLPLEL